ncbi:MAG: ATP-binding protein [Gaiellaceae bacterium]
MRWWLGLAFAVIAALTAVLVAEGLMLRSETAFRKDAEARAVANSIAAGAALRTSLVRGNLGEALETVSERRRLALFLFDNTGRPITPARAAQTELRSIPQADAAVGAALDGRRYVRSYDEGRVTVVALPMPWDSAAALLTYSLQPGYGSTMTVIRDQILPVVTLAVALSGLAGLLIATLTTRRLRRIGKAAHAIESGDFSHRLEPRFHDEVGSLAVMVDRMRMRLQQSFERLQAERLRLRRTLERLDHGVLTLDAELNVESANDAARVLVKGLVEGTPLPEPWPDFPLRSFASDLFVEGAKVKRVRVSPREGLLYTVYGIPADKGSPTAVLVIADVSELERREQIEREFVANAAHELRTPVAAISSAVEVLEAGAKDRLPERDHFLAIIDRQSRRLARLSRSLLVLARAQTGEEVVQTVAVDLCSLLEEVAASLQTNDQVLVEVDCPVGLMVLAELDLVEQVFSNLAANAAQHTRRGRIRITARPRGDDKVAIELVDTGDGIPSEMQPRIFDRFYRGGTHDANGFGLGLAIVRQAVRALDGTIELDSAVDAGTTVRITLPIAEVA